MAVTPWGDIEELRGRRLSPGPGNPPEEVARNQRERLFAAMVVCCDERGYRETAVADLVRLSGVSRSTFYAHFDDKEDCFVATAERLLGDAVASVRKLVEHDAPGEQRARRVLDALVRLMAAQRAAARLCLIESYAAGERAVAVVRAGIEEINRLGLLALSQMPDHSGLTDELARAIVSGFHRVVYDRLHTRREDELPGLVPALWDWAMGYPPPPQPLRVRGRRPASTPEGEAPPFAAYSPEQRIIRAFSAVVAEKGYGATTIADIAAAASISQGTFYAHFADKADAMSAALDSSGAQMLAAALPTARRAPDWAHAVRAAAGAICGFLAAEPAFARLRIIAVYEAGPAAIVQRDMTGIEMLRAIIGPVFDELPELADVVMEAIIGAINGVMHDQVLSAGTAALPEVAPLITYVALTPILGAERACEIANGDGRAASPRRRAAAPG